MGCANKSESSVDHLAALTKSSEERLVDSHFGMEMKVKLDLMIQTSVVRD